VAHEINNPISGVLNLSMLMQRILKDDGIPQERVPEFRKYLAQVVQETSRVGRIVSDLLSFSRRSKPQRAEADLNRIVKTTLSLTSHKLKLANVTVNAELAEDLPAVRCDTSQIQQVVLNLVLNGRRPPTRARSGGSRCVRGAPRNGEAVTLSVEDNGEGVRPENLSRIFDPFFTTKPEGKGVGLGLAVSYGIVEAHGGDIAVTSSPARSHLHGDPAGVLSRRRAGAGGGRSGAGMKTRWEILTVDDEEVMCESLALAARRRVSGGHGIVGREAIEKAAAKDYAIYFIDLKMPGGMDGIETMMKSGACTPKRRSLSSRIRHGGYGDTAMKEGAQEYIVKPCNPEEISLLVGRIIKVKNLQREIPSCARS